MCYWQHNPAEHHISPQWTQSVRVTACYCYVLLTAQYCWASYLSSMNQTLPLQQTLTRLSLTGDGSSQRVGIHSMKTSSGLRHIILITLLSALYHYRLVISLKNFSWLLFVNFSHLCLQNSFIVCYVKCSEWSLQPIFLCCFILSLSLSLQFNGHFSRWTWVSQYQNVHILDLLFYSWYLTSF